jgi:hypothetical protein
MSRHEAHTYSFAMLKDPLSQATYHVYSSLAIL